MAEVTAPIVREPERTVAVAGRAFVKHLQAKGRSKSHIETAESHLHVHLEPLFTDRPIDRIREADVTRLLARPRRAGRKPKTLRNILSTLDEEDAGSGGRVREAPG